MRERLRVQPDPLGCQAGWIEYLLTAWTDSGLAIRCTRSVPPRMAGNRRIILDIVDDMRAAAARELDGSR